MTTGYTPNIEDRVLTLTAEDAKAVLSELGYRMRVTRRDHERYMVTQDIHPNRVNVELDENIVKKAYIG